MKKNPLCKRKTFFVFEDVKVPWRIEVKAIQFTGDNVGKVLKHLREYNNCEDIINWFITTFYPQPKLKIWNNIDKYIIIQSGEYIGYNENNNQFYKFNE